MRKLTLITATALALTCFGGQAFNVQAATQNNSQVCLGGNKIIITYKSDCNIQNILDKLENCFPGISLPECEVPDSNVPETDVPEVDVPEVEKPESNVPEVDIPEADIPEADDPETDKPEVDMPEVDIPETDAPETDKPEVDTPDGDTPETDAPEMDKPESDIPETNLPENNTPDNNPENDSTEDSAPEDGVTGEHAFIKQVVELVNIERAKEGLSPLSVDENVQAAAMVRAKECEQSFSHTRPNGTSFSTALKEQNVSYRRAGENIAWGQKTPEEVVAAWMNSSGHRANIMNPNFTSIGVGYYENERGTDYWCQLFIG